MTLGTNLPASAEAKIIRQFKAPRALVYEAWANPDYLVRWFSPDGFRMVIRHFDFRTGGSLDFSFIGPDGSEHAALAKYVAIVPEERIEWTGEFPNGPADQLRTTITFADCDGGTEVRVHQIMSPVTPETAFAAAGMQIGWDQTIENLAKFLAERTSQPEDSHG
ncbi:MAG TPA: SRPBCC domain-containing protein [Oscillatoriaceae cyanobacterium]